MHRINDKFLIFQLHPPPKKCKMNEFDRWVLLIGIAVVGAVITLFKSNVITAPHQVDKAVLCIGILITILVCALFSIKLA